MRKNTSLVWIFFLFFSVVAFAQKGKSGFLTVSSTIKVNEYTSLTVDASAGNTAITVANSGLNTNNRFSASLSAGDLIMIIQMQGATINGIPDPGNPNISLPNDSSWGAVLNYNNCGNYEFREVASVPNGTTINLSCALANNYTAAGKVQIVRIPRYGTLTINNGGTIACDPWDSVSGGIIAIEDSGNTIINTGGQINASFNGFRGGALLNSNNIQTGITYFASDKPRINGAYKGESIAGYQNDYNPFGGGVCRGAPANGGGGGDSWNGGGGGGANGGNVAGWINGDGIPDISQAGYVTAWNLEYSWMSSFVGAGGGRGGYTWCNSGPDPLVFGPGYSGYGGDSRRSVGGLGGRPLDYTTGRLFFGGGGGCGSEDNSDGGYGGSGGGMVYLISYENVSGGGMIVSNGQNGVTDTIAPGDGPGGAGAGGTIVVNSKGAISGITIEANGATGGGQTINTGEGEGPGGGGGGGYIATTNAVTTSVTGGHNGTTLTFPTFPANGSTMGSSGTTALIPKLTTAIAVTDTTYCIGDSTRFSGSFASLYSTGGAVTWDWKFTGGSPATSSLQNPAVSFGTSGIHNVSLIITSCDGNDTLKRNVDITISPAPSITFSGKDSVCAGSGTTIIAAGGTSYSWSPGGSTNASLNVSPASTTTYTVSVSNGVCSKDSTITVTVSNPPSITLTPPRELCIGDSFMLVATGGGSYKWNTGATTSSIYVKPDANTSYTVVVVKNGCKDSASTTIPVDVPTLTACCDTVITKGGSVLINAFDATNYLWLPASSLSCSACPSPVASPSVTTTYTVFTTDGNGCTLQKYVTVDVNIPCADFTVPNVFTPNNDGINDDFVINVLNPLSYSIDVFDRWGKQVYTSTNPSTYWTGRILSTDYLVPDGTYYYIIKANCGSNNYIKKGFVQVLGEE